MKNPDNIKENICLLHLEACSKKNLGQYDT